MTSFPPVGEDLLDEAGNPIVAWDLVNNLRIEYASDGTNVPRSLTPEEVALVPDILAARTIREQREIDRQTIGAIVTDLKLEKDRAQAVIDNANSTAREKDLGRATKRIADAAINLAKFVRDM